MKLRERPFQLTQEMAEELNRELEQAVPEQPRLPLLVEREHTHGRFHDNAALSQSLKTCFRTMPNWIKLQPEQRESIDLICTKFGRIMTGSPLVKDHWDDIAGYAKLGSEVCE